jgi:phage FluMu protein Com
MSIEFNCSECGQHLRVAESAAGKRAKCPKCSHINQVPEAPSDLLDDGLSGLDDSEYSLAPEEKQPKPAESPFAGSSSSANPYASPQTGYATGSAAAVGKGGRIRNVQADVGSILNYSVALWQEHLGLLVGATVVVGAINIGFSFGQGMATEGLRMADQPALAAIVELIGTFVSQAIQLYLGIGVTQMMMNMARKKRADFSDIFNGGSRFLPVLGVSLLFGLALLFGFLLLIVPGVIMLLIWWPCYYLVVDDKSEVFESFSVARTITEGNMGTIVLVWLVGLGISLLGCLALCVGLLFAAPLVGMMYVVSYLMMSGQIPLTAKTATTQRLL